LQCPDSRNAPSEFRGFHGRFYIDFSGQSLCHQNLSAERIEEDFLFRENYAMEHETRIAVFPSTMGPTVPIGRRPTVTNLLKFLWKMDTDR
jgi:hypothetical protein